MDPVRRHGMAATPLSALATGAQRRHAQPRTAHVCDECCPFPSDARFDDDFPPASVDQEFEEYFFE